jgi:brefeldin A-inhibited guanine nucleotide-exchange protein
LVEHFREHLKQEIAAFIESVFLKILDSKNSSFNHVIYALHVLNKIFQNPKTILEFYVNYDCSEDNPFLVQKIIGKLFKQICYLKLHKENIKKAIFKSRFNSIKNLF